MASLLLAGVIGFTSFGRRLYLFGGNPVVARFSGINNEKMTITVFLLTALLSGMAGLIILSRVNSAKVGYGDTYLLQTMIVCVIGGISPNGGVGHRYYFNAGNVQRFYHIILITIYKKIDMGDYAYSCIRLK